MVFFQLIVFLANLLATRCNRAAAGNHDCIRFHSFLSDVSAESKFRQLPRDKVNAGAKTANCTSASQ